MSVGRPAVRRAGASAALVLWAALAACLLVLAPPRAWADPAYPALTGRVVDDAHVLTPEAQADLTSKLAALESSTGRQLVVATVPSLGGSEIEDYGVGLIRAWKIGSKAKNDGAILLVAPTEKKVRVEVGYGLEGELTDAFSELLIQRRILPKFRAGDISGGIVDGTDALIAQLQLPEDQARANLAQAQADQEARAARAQQTRHGHGLPAGLIFGAFFLFWLLSAFGRRGGRGGGGGLGWLLPMLIFNGLGGGGRRDDGWGGGGGGWGGGGGDGGGFSGGGGSGGGGGASGSW